MAEAEAEAEAEAAARSLRRQPPHHFLALARLVQLPSHVKDPRRISSSSISSPQPAMATVTCDCSRHGLRRDVETRSGLHRGSCKRERGGRRREVPFGPTYFRSQAEIISRSTVRMYNEMNVCKLNGANSTEGTPLSLPPQTQRRAPVDFAVEFAKNAKSTQTNKEQPLVYRLS